MGIKERIEAAKEKLEKAQRAKTVAETQLETAQKQVNDVVEEMKKYGVSPDTIDDEIKKLSEAVEEGLKAVEDGIPEV